MIPLVWGWYAVGTHHGRGDDVIRRLYDSVKDIHLSDDEQMGSRDDVAIITIRDGCDIDQTSGSDLEEDSNSGMSRARELSLFGFTIESDELADGPFYNHARSKTWSHLSDFVVAAYTNSKKQHRVVYSPIYTSVQVSIEPHEGEHTPLFPQAPDTTIDSGNNPAASRTSGQASVEPHDDPNTAHMNELYKNALQRCGFPQLGGRLPSFRSATKESDTGSGFRTTIAFVLAFIVQGITSWSAFMIAYNTPTVGIGCRSFTYMMYTLVSTFSCLLFILSSYCYNRQSCLRERHDDCEIEPRRSRSQSHTMSRGSDSGEMIELGDMSSRRSQMHTERKGADRGDLEMVQTFSFLDAVSIMALLSGKMLAILNAFFIVTSCILEFAGVYQNCFCNSSYIGLKGKAYVGFLNASVLVDIARPYWYSGAGVTVFTVLFVGLYFDLARRG